ncbi:hypothetical protein K443DRAFT_676191 [Laccaria amethystina LaAM-08-1]|uniref:Uncharacterized protein n=1 Tax=Laccaria amethystina LaAM-08-1 TaxID=1095629 RepID=A0A0C9Y857_9AGAR|nr:hypothetical protein K443DRAFT_676191 [Laccaria amethystina LaAM-08-1]
MARSHRSAGHMYLKNVRKGAFKLMVAWRREEKGKKAGLVRSAVSSERNSTLGDVVRSWDRIVAKSKPRLLPNSKCQRTNCMSPARPAHVGIFCKIPGPQPGGRLCSVDNECDSAQGL